MSVDRGGCVELLRHVCAVIYLMHIICVLFVVDKDVVRNSLML